MYNRHHRSDALSSGVAMVAIAGSYAGISVLDPLGGLVVSGMLLKSTFGITKSSLRDLTDRGMDLTEVDKIRRILTQIKVYFLFGYIFVCFFFLFFLTYYAMNECFKLIIVYM